MNSLISSISNVIWGPPVLLLFIATGLHLSIRGKFFQITKPKQILSLIFNSFKEKKTLSQVSPFSAFCSVLGACIGTGNIIGVATAINCGGPGVVFWMVLSAFLSMAIAYTENYLGAKYTEKHGFDNKTIGSFAYIEKGLKMIKTSKAYALFCLLSVFGMGNVTQSNSIAEILKVTFNVPVKYTVIILCLVTFVVMKGGIKRISNLQTILVPVATLFYLVISFWVIVSNKDNLFYTIKLILSNAFSFKAFKGFNAYSALRYGIARGVFSNEAGLGSATLLHAQAHTANAQSQGVMATAEVFVDTIFMCSITALVILTSTDIYASDLFGAELSLMAYSSIGKIGKQAISILTVTFAFTSLVSCSFYGEKSVQYLSGRNIATYKFIYLFVALIGCINPPRVVWALADICNGLMAVPNLFALNCLAKEVNYSFRT